MKERAGQRQKLVPQRLQIKKTKKMLMAIEHKDRQDDAF